MTRLPPALLQHIALQCHAQTARPGERLQGLWSGYGEVRRVYLQGIGEPDAPASVILKRVTPPKPESGASLTRSHQRKLRSYAVELAFYQRWAAQCAPPCRVARALHCEAQGNEWTFVLEDLGAAGYPLRRDSFFRDGADASGQEARACLSWLAHFHATFMGLRPATLWPRGTYWHLATRPDELAASVDPRLQQAAPRLDARLRDATYQTLVHGDAKVENFCFSPIPDEVAGLDFQYVGPGTGVQDVAYFFSSCLSAEACQRHADDLLEHYFNALRSSLADLQPNIDAAAVEAEWRDLYAIAWGDFCRFLSGWSPGHHKLHAYSERQTALALAACGLKP